MTFRSSGKENNDFSGNGGLFINDEMDLLIMIVLPDFA